MTDEERKELQLDQLENVAGGAGIIDTSIQTLEELENADIFGMIKSLFKFAKVMTKDKDRLIENLKGAAADAGITFADGVIEDFVDKYYDLL